MSLILSLFNAKHIGSSYKHLVLSTEAVILFFDFDYENQDIYAIINISAFSMLF